MTSIPNNNNAGDSQDLQQSDSISMDSPTAQSFHTCRSDGFQHPQNGDRNPSVPSSIAVGRQPDLSSENVHLTTLDGFLTEKPVAELAPQDKGLRAWSYVVATFAMYIVVWGEKFPC
jgi:hypothetical protein